MFVFFVVFFLRSVIVSKNIKKTQTISYFDEKLKNFVKSHSQGRVIISIGIFSNFSLKLKKNNRLLFVLIIFGNVQQEMSNFNVFRPSIIRQNRRSVESKKIGGPGGGAPWLPWAQSPQNAFYFHHK